ncbi:MAG: TIGR02679 family protein [Acidimicrobiales bacterium]
MSAGLDRPGLAPVWAELARRFGEGQPPVAITLRDLSLSERRAVADLLGLDRLPRETARLRVDRLAAACGVGDRDGLRAMVERRLGPIVDRREIRQADRRAREDLWSWLAAEARGLPLARSDPDRLESWVGTARALGVPGGDVERHRRRLAAVLSVLAALPADGIGLAALADDLLGDPHALDRGRSAAALVLEAVAVARNRPRPSDAEAVRLLWEEMGVVPDPLSSTVLALGLRPPPDHPLRSACATGEPVVLTLSQLRRWPLDPLPDGDVAYVVENPSLLAEASGKGWDGPPLVCSSGRPTIAVVTLVRQLRAAGADVFQHADFDGAGLGITAWMAERAGTTPWRMGAGDYLAAVAVRRPRVPLLGRLPSTPWDPRLAGAMTEHGVAVHEEETRSDLLAAMNR